MVSMHSVAVTLRKMTPKQRGMAKIKIQQILYEIQYCMPPQSSYLENYHSMTINTEYYGCNPIVFSYDIVTFQHESCNVCMCVCVCVREKYYTTIILLLHQFYRCWPESWTRAYCHATSPSRVVMKCIRVSRKSEAERECVATNMLNTL